MVTYWVCDLGGKTAAVNNDLGVIIMACNLCDDCDEEKCPRSCCCRLEYCEGQEVIASKRMGLFASLRSASKTKDD